MIVIIDYDMGNVGSIKNMLEHIGVTDVTITSDRSEILSADRIILPGVGSFDMGMKNLYDRGLVDTIRFYANELKKPVLGICLGMQLLGKSSEEGNASGLGLIPFSNLKFRFENDSNLKVPHMGWDLVEVIDQTNPLVKDLGSSFRYYFVHSYYAKCENVEHILMKCDYGIQFAASVHMNNVYGVQFHPEKSHQFGMKLLENFLKV